ncbi:MAG: sulfur carrier protein ThiS adenylyltransferase ThiF [Desulfobulbus sp.]|jgi:sulfur carrier protein ThiS adenylyltransferase
MRVGIAGVGGIGSNVAAVLVRSGIRRLTLVDFDRVEASNLNRQFYFADQVGRLKVEALAENLRRIVPDLLLTIHAVAVTAANCASLFHDCAVVAEGFDGRADKKMLLETLGRERRVIAASGIAGASLEGIEVRRFGGCRIVGDFVTDCGHAPLFAHKVMSVANLMAALILEEVSHGKTSFSHRDPRDHG